MLLSSILNVLHPQTEIAVEAPGCAVEDEEDPALTGVCAGFDAETDGALAAEGLEVHFVGCVAGEVAWCCAGGVDAVFEVGALFGDCGDLVLGWWLVGGERWRGGWKEGGVLW